MFTFANLSLFFSLYDYSVRKFINANLNSPLDNHCKRLTYLRNALPRLPSYCKSSFNREYTW